MVSGLSLEKQIMHAFSGIFQSKFMKLGLSKQPELISCGRILKPNAGLVETHAIGKDRHLLITAALLS